VRQWGRTGGNALWKIPMNNDDDRAQQAILTTLFHWGLHGWVVGAYTRPLFSST